MGSYKHTNYVKTVRVKSGWKYSLNQQFEGVFNMIRPRSVKSKNQYKSVLNDIRDVLRKEFRLKKLSNLKTKHFDKIIEIWKERGYKPGTLADRMAILRKFAEVTEKVSCIKKNNEYGIRRGKQVFCEKRWTEEGIKDRELIKKVDSGIHKYGDRIRHVLYLQRLFGLRKREALMFGVEQVTTDDRGEPRKITVIRGAKNGRRREVPIVSGEQRNFIKYLCRTYVSSNIQPKDMKYTKWENIYYYVLKKIGVKGDIKGHGLRQGYAYDRYKQLREQIKEEYSNRGIYIKENDLKNVVYGLLTEELGHSRINILKNYLRDY